MSARASIQPSQGRALCPRGGNQYPKPLQTPGEILSLKRAGTFSYGRLVAEKSTFRLHNTLTSNWSADYTSARELPADVRSHGLGFEAVYGEGIASSSSYAQSSDVRVPVNGNSAAGLQGVANAGDAATRDGCRENVAVPIPKDDVALETQAAGLDDDLDYYVPVVGHRVVGVVVSGNYAKLDVDIGAAKLGHLHVQDLLPLDKLNIDESKWILSDDAGEGGDGGSPETPSLGRLHVVYDEEVYTYEAPEPLVVDIGTVLELEVVGQTMSGNPLLSVRKAAQRLQWDRVMQVRLLLLLC